ncbi:MAG TPA: ABC transporter ATP-binding protein [Candidatus Obscuribacterales bacterium]
MEALIKLENVTLKFRRYADKAPALKESVINKLSGNKSAITRAEDFVALNKVNLEIRGGERVGIIGLNGAGKSTLLKTIVGIYKPQSGRITVRGQITPLIELGTGFDPECTGRENIYLNGSMLGRTRQQMRGYEPHIIDFADLHEFIDVPIKYYSSGMQGRLAYAIGTMLEPEILLVDEVFSTGDARFVNKAMNRMTHLFNNSQIVIMVSHGLENIKRICNRIVLLNHGSVIMDGKTEEVCDYYLKCIVNAEPTSEEQELQSLREQNALLLEKVEKQRVQLKLLKERLIKLNILQSETEAVGEDLAVLSPSFHSLLSRVNTEESTMREQNEMLVKKVEEQRRRLILFKQKAREFNAMLREKGWQGEEFALKIAPGEVSAN